MEKHEAKTAVEVKLKIGELTLLNHEQLDFSLKTLWQGTKIEKIEVTIQAVKARLKCRKCGFEWFPGKIVKSPSLSHLSNLSCVQCDGAVNLIMRCPKCDDDDADGLAGNECIIDEIILGT